MEIVIRAAVLSSWATSFSRGVTQQDYSVTSAVLAVGVFALLTLALAWANARFPRVRGVTHGVPVIIVRDGIPDLQRHSLGA